MFLGYVLVYDEQIDVDVLGIFDQIQIGRWSNVQNFVDPRVNVCTDLLSIFLHHLFTVHAII